MATTIYGSLFVEKGDQRIEVCESDSGKSLWLALGTVGVHVDSAETAERVAIAARDLAQRMWARERAVPVEFLAPDRIPESSDAALMEPVEVMSDV